MENQTLVKEQPSKWRQPVSLKSEDVKNAIHEMVDKIQSFSEQNNLVIMTPGGAETNSLQALKNFNSNAIADLSRRSKKKITKQIFRLNQKMTLTRMNRFISFICNVIPEIEKYRILPSKQEQSIIDLRDKYKNVREEFFKARSEFKNSKKEYKNSGQQYFV